MTFTLPTKHQVAVAGTHAVVGAGSALAALAYFGVLSPSDLQSATDDVKRIAADLSDLYAAVASLVVIGTTVFATIKSGPLASLFRAAASISRDPVKMAEVQAAPISEKANVVAITDNLPEVVSVSTAPTRAGSLLASAVPSPTVAVVAKVLLIAFALSLFLPMGAQAQTAKKPNQSLNLPIDPLHLNGTAITGDPSVDLKALWAKIVSASATDLSYASAMAAAAATPAAKQRKQCWDAIAAINAEVNGAGLKDATGAPLTKPSPSLFADIESQAEILDNLSPQGALFTSCAAAAEMAKADVLQFVNAIVTGAAGLAAGGIAIP